MAKRAMVAAVAVLLAVMVLPGVEAAEAAPAANAEHCVQRVQGQKASGELTLSPSRCFGTFAQAMQAEGVLVWGDGVATSGVMAASGTLAIHYDWAGGNPAGGSTSTVGSSCAGGYINVSAAWNNRISSTENVLCGRVRHWDAANLGGIWQDTVGAGGNLGSLNNKASSIQYL